MTVSKDYEIGDSVMRAGVEYIQNPGFTDSTIILTNDCNLSCEYCYKPNGEVDYLTTDMAKKIVDILVDGVLRTRESIKNGKQKPRFRIPGGGTCEIVQCSGDDQKYYEPQLNIIFFGGEPVLNVPVMRYIFDYANRMAKQHEFQVYYKLITNSSLWTTEYEEFLRYWFSTSGRVDIQLSIDGVPEVLDHDRKFKRYLTSSDLTLFQPSAAIEYVAKKHVKLAKMLDIPSGMIYSHACVTKFSLPYLKKSYDYIRDVIGLSSAWFMPVPEESWDDDDIPIFRNQYQSVADRILEESMERKDSSLLSSFGSFIYRTHKPTRFCGVGTTLCTVDTDGTIYPCHRFKYPEEKRIVLGHVDKGFDRHVWLGFHECEDAFAKTCGIQNCGECTNNNCKVCPAVNYEKHDSLFLGFPPYCKLSLEEDKIRRELNEKLKTLSDLNTEKNMLVENTEMDAIRRCLIVTKESVRSTNVRPTDEDQYVTNPRFTSCSVNISNDCNLSCKYCFQKENFKNAMMTPEMAEKVIDFLIQGAQQSQNQNNRTISVMFFGGEPTLNIPTMKHMIDYACRRGRETNVRPSFNIDTNCTIWSGEYEEFLTYWYKTMGNVIIQLSIDGVPEVLDHDRKFRFPQFNVTPAQQINYVAKQYAEWAKKNNVPPGSIHIRASVSKFSLPFAKRSYDYIRDELGYPFIWFMPIHEEPWDDSDVELFKEQYQLIADRIYDDTIKRRDLLLYNGFSSLQCKQKQEKPCAAGGTYCTVDTDGTIYFCHRTQKPEKERSIIIGHVDKGILSSILDKYANLTTSICEGITNCETCRNSNCKYCFAANFEQNGNMFKGFPNYCKIALAENDIRLELRSRLEADPNIKALLEQTNQNNNAGNRNMFQHDFGRSFMDIHRKIDTINTSIIESMDKQNSIIESLVASIKELVDTTRILVERSEEITSSTTKDRNMIQEQPFLVARKNV